MKKNLKSIKLLEIVLNSQLRDGEKLETLPREPFQSFLVLSMMLMKD
jgi:hypothetical protein